MLLQLLQTFNQLSPFKIIFLLFEILELNNSQTITSCTSTSLGEIKNNSKVFHPQRITSNEPKYGYITSNGYPKHYLPDQHCIVELIAPQASGLVVHLRFIDFDLEDVYSKSRQCFRDYLLVTIIDREGREHIGERFCGQELPAPFESMQTRIRVSFVSSYSSTSRHRGFKLRYQFILEASVPAPLSVFNDYDKRFWAECGGKNDPDTVNGEIKSPGFPFTYPKDVSCNWLIRVPSNRRIYIRLLHLELSPTSAECDRSSLQIIDGYRHVSDHEPSVRRFSDMNSADMKFCGDQSYYKEEGMKSYLSTGNRVIIRFNTKDYPVASQLENYRSNGTAIGFRLLWTEVNSLVLTQSENQQLSGIARHGDAVSPETIFPVIFAVSQCDGFLCQGGEFCVDDGQKICAERTRLCINESLQCNGISNCAENDNSDEVYCYSQSPASLVVVSTLLLLLITILLCFTYYAFKHLKVVNRKESEQSIRDLWHAKKMSMHTENIHSKDHGRKTKQNGVTTSNWAYKEESFNEEKFKKPPNTILPVIEVESPDTQNNFQKYKNNARGVKSSSEPPPPSLCIIEEESCDNINIISNSKPSKIHGCTVDNRAGGEEPKSRIASNSMKKNSRSIANNYSENLNKLEEKEDLKLPCLCPIPPSRSTLELLSNGFNANEPPDGRKNQAQTGHYAKDLESEEPIWIYGKIEIQN